MLQASVRLHLCCPRAQPVETYLLLLPPCKTAPAPLLCDRRSDEADLSRREVVDLAVHTGGPLSVTCQGPAGISGASNYWLDIHPPLGEAPAGGQAVAQCGGDAGAGAGCGEGAPADAAARVWLLDSQNSGCPPLTSGWCVSVARALAAACAAVRGCGLQAANKVCHVQASPAPAQSSRAMPACLPRLCRGCVGDDAVAWVNASLAGMPRVPSLAFVHIPVPQVQARAGRREGCVGRAAGRSREAPRGMCCVLGRPLHPSTPWPACCRRRSGATRRAWSHCALLLHPSPSLLTLSPSLRCRLPTSLCPAHPPHAALQFEAAWSEGWPAVGRKTEEVSCPDRDSGLFGLARQERHLGLSWRCFQHFAAPRVPHMVRKGRGGACGERW